MFQRRRVIATNFPRPLLHRGRICDAQRAMPNGLQCSRTTIGKVDPFSLHALPHLPRRLLVPYVPLRFSFEGKVHCPALSRSIIPRKAAVNRRASSPAVILEKYSRNFRSITSSISRRGMCSRERTYFTGSQQEAAQALEKRSNNRPSSRKGQIGSTIR